MQLYTALYLFIIKKYNIIIGVGQYLSHGTQTWTVMGYCVYTHTLANNSPYSTSKL